MKLNVLTFLIATLGIYGCSTTHQNGAKTEDPALYRAFRGPAAALEFEKYDQAFEELMTDSDPTAHFMKKFDRLTQFYIFAEDHLQVFDEELDQAYIAARSGKKVSPTIYTKNYAKLLSVRIHMTELREEIAYLYFKLLEYSLNNEPFFTLADFDNVNDAYQKAFDHYKTRRELALKIRGEVYKKILVGLSHDQTDFDPKSLSAEEQIREVALDEVRNLMSTTASQYVADFRKDIKQKGKDLPPEIEEFESIDLDKNYSPYFKTQKDFERFAGSSDFKQVVLEGAKTLILEPEVEASLKLRSKEVYDSLKLNKKGLFRSPNSGSALLYPSMDSHGNITGNTFPEGTWALTYDDGPHGIYTMQDVANLKKQNFKASFFWLAQNVSIYPKIVAQVQSEGFPHNNHSWTHPQLSKMNPTQLHHEIDEAQAKETEIYNANGGKDDPSLKDGPDLTPKFFRAPYGDGANLPRVRQHIVDNKLIHVFWNVDTLDWQDHNPETIKARAVKQIVALKHGVILFHDIHPQSVVASDLLMSWFHDQMKAGQKLRLVTISDIVDEINRVPDKVTGLPFSAGPYSGQTRGTSVPITH